MDERVDCKTCAKKCVPRLWHLKGNIIRRKKIQHLCPYCGTVMYETGGGIGLGIAIVGTVFIAYFVVTLNQSLNHEEYSSQLIELEIDELQKKIRKYEEEISVLENKTEGGKNPQLLGQLEGKPERLSKIKDLLNKKISNLSQSNKSRDL